MKMSRELDPGSTEVVRIESEGEMESKVSGPLEEKGVEEGEFPLYFECACFCPVPLTLSSCVVSGGEVLREPKSRGFLSSSESESDEERVSARSSVSAMRASKRSRSASVSAMRTSKKIRPEGGSADKMGELGFSALVTETPKRTVSRVSRDTACSSDDDQMGPRTPMPLDGEIVEEGELYLVFWRTLKAPDWSPGGWGHP